MKVTVRDIAEKVGLSATSVSLVLNNKPSRITDESKQKIIKAAKEMGYIHKEKKIEPKPMKEKIIGVIHPNLNNLFLNQCICGIESYASLHNYKVLICNVDDTTERTLEYLELLNKLGAEGVIVIPPMDMNVEGNNIGLGEFFKKSKMQILLLDRAIDRVFSDFITSDNKQGAYLATEYLILCGHENIGIIAGTRDVYTSRKRVEGYKEALAYYNISIKNENIYYGDFKSSSGYEAADYFMKKNINAIFTCNDEMAFGVYHYAKDNGLVIGDEISVVGYDDVSICDKLTPTLTSIHQPGELMGKRACELIIKRIKKLEEGTVRDIYFTPQLVERNSVKKVNIN